VRNMFLLLNHSGVLNKTQRSRTKNLVCRILGVISFRAMTKRKKKQRAHRDTKGKMGRLKLFPKDGEREILQRWCGEACGFKKDYVPKKD